MQQATAEAAPALQLVDAPPAVDHLPAAAPAFSVQQAAPRPADLLQRALAQNADAALLERLWNLQMAYEANEARKAMNTAFAQFKAKAITIMKTKHVSFPSKGGTTEYDHAELAGVLEAVTPALSEFGLSISWNVGEQHTDWISVVCTLKHAQGASESVTLGAAPDHSGGKNDIQAIGSAMTYLERYTAKAILGVAEKGQDNDGRGAPAGASTSAAAETDQQQQPRPVDPRKAGQAAAQQGMKALTAWWGDLSRRQRSELNSDFGAMRKVANRVDRETSHA